MMYFKEGVSKETSSFLLDSNSRFVCGCIFAIGVDV